MWSFIVAIVAFEENDRQMLIVKLLQILDSSVMPTLEEVEIPMDEEESFLSQFWEKLCSPDHSFFGF